MSPGPFEVPGIEEINAGRTDEENTGLDPVVELPFHDQMAEKMSSSVPDAAERLDRSDLFAYDAGLDELAVDLVAIAKANQHRLS